MWKAILLLVVCWRITDGNNIGICENKTLTTESGFLNRVNKNGPTNCWCQIISETGSLTKVTFNVISFIGHQYKLNVSDGTSSPKFENNASAVIFYTISGSEEIKLKLEGNNCSVNDGLEFGIIINSTRGHIKITCHNPKMSTTKLCPTATSTDTTNSISPVTTTTSTRTATTTTSTTSTRTTTTSTVTTTTSSSTVTSSTGTNPTTVSSEDITSTEQNYEGNKNGRNGNTSNKTATGDLDIGLIGGVVGGAVVLIVLILILIICLVKRKRRRKKDQYDQPSPARPPPDAGYTDVDLGTQVNGHSSPGVMIIEDNPVYHSANNSLPPSQIDTKQRDANPVQMEIIENDLYVSSDDVINYKSNDDTSQQPEVEYAVVNKKRKPDNDASADSGVSVSSNEPNSGPERKFVLGPKGDEYTLVTKT